MDRFCLDCNAFLKGRADKKFCNDLCRSNYNNRLKVDDHHYINSINQILRKNRNILKSQNPTGKTRVKRSSLIRKGFDFSFHTHYYTTKSGNFYFFCYEYGYLLLENNEALLVKREVKPIQFTL
ncbi:MAG: hypothetical protein V4541_09305 [Bacteroidota bacterium]